MFDSIFRNKPVLIVFWCISKMCLISICYELHVQRNLFSLCIIMLLFIAKIIVESHFPDNITEIHTTFFLLQWSLWVTMSFTNYKIIVDDDLSGLLLISDLAHFGFSIFRMVYHPDKFFNLLNLCTIIIGMILTFLLIRHPIIFLFIGFSMGCSILLKKLLKGYFILTCTQDPISNFRFLVNFYLNRNTTLSGKRAHQLYSYLETDQEYKLHWLKYVHIEQLFLSCNGESKFTQGFTTSCQIANSLLYDRYTPGKYTSMFLKCTNADNNIDLLIMGYILSYLSAIFYPVLHSTSFVVPLYKLLLLASFNCAVLSVPYFRYICSIKFLLVADSITIPNLDRLKHIVYDNMLKDYSEQFLDPYLPLDLIDIITEYNSETKLILQCQHCS